MFSDDSRYRQQGLYIAVTADGREIPAVTLPLPPQGLPLAGFYQRPQGERLDLVAARFLQRPSWFWKLCDANNCPVPDGLAAQPLIGVPAGYGV